MNNKYQNIEVNETVLMAYINAESSIIENAAVEKWLAVSNENKVLFDSLKKTWEAAGKLVPEPVAVDTEAAWLKVKSSINSTPVVPISKNKTNYLKIALGIAASLALLVTVFNFWDKPIESFELRATNTILDKTLADGSEITINKNSELTYPESFGEDERKVELEGNAFFDIARDTSRPFTIDLPENSYVKVLGTSFTINTNDINNTTTVFVKTGKVEFGNKTSKLILLPNEKGIFNNATKTFEKVISEDQKASELYWIDQQLSFEGEKLEDIIDVLSTVFNVDIELQCLEAATYPIISNHQREDLDDILQVISLVHDLTIKKQTKSGQTNYTITCND